MNRIAAQLEIVEVSSTEFDILIFSSDKVLSAFKKIYENIFFIENSNFGRPVVVVPGFGSKEQADLWRNYWIEVLNNPEKACNSCPTVQAFIEEVNS